LRAFGFPTLPLRWLIALAFGALATALIAGIGLLVEHEGERRLRSSNATRLGHVAEHVAMQVERRLQDHWQFLRAFRDSLPVGEADPSDWMKVERIRNIRRMHPEFDLIAIASMDSTILIADPADAVGRRLVGIHDAPDGGRIEFMPIADARSRLAVPTFWLPMRDAGAADRALLAQLDWNRLADLLDPTRLDRHADDGLQILLVASQAVVELAPTGRIEVTTSPERRAALARLDAARSDLDWDGRAHAGVRVPLASARADMPIALEVVVLEDRLAALQPLAELRRSVLRWGGVFVASAMLLGWLLACWIAAPLDRIARAAARDASPIDLRPGALGYREIAQLAASLTRLLDRAREEGERRATAFETSLDGVVVIDEDGRVDSMNAAAQRMFGRAVAAPADIHVRLLLPEPRSDEHDGYMRRLLGGEEQRLPGIGRVLYGRRADGATFPCLVAMGESKLTGGRRVYIAFIRDLSSARENERKLRNAQAEIDSMHRLTSVGQVGSQLSHEINQPLGAIANYAQAARQLINGEGAAGLHRVDELLGKLISQVDRASSILRRLRRFVATPAAARKPRDINALIRRSIALAIADPSFDHIRVSTDLAPDLPRVHIDQVEMQQVLTNLIINAGEAMAHSDEAILDIRSRLRDDGVAIEVADHGPGLDPAAADRLFQPFVTTKPEGLGLGLSICRSIVEAHQGTIAAAPNPGGGTVFTITLPLEGTDG
jgi:two-component system sensor kinase FixL